ncbi:MAG: hypothetical protein PSV24_03195 [Rhodoferax sp.]|nr:hypothetical protein [Rhodoferax sp.]
MMKTLCTAAALALLSSVVAAKLPAPSDEAKAKAAEAAAKTAWAGKVDGFLLCKSQDKVVAHYKKSATKVATVAVKGAAPASACADPGPFVYVPAGAAPAAAAAPAAPAAVPAKKS